MNKTIYFLGPKTSYSDLAKEEFAKKLGLVEYIEKPMKTITALVKEFCNVCDENTYAVLPIENSIEGTVKETLDSIANIENKDIKILSETTIKIEHCLISFAKSYGEITNIKSHPQALSQCFEYIYEKFGDNITTQVESSTANAVKNLVEDNPSFAAIGNKYSAEFYNKPILDVGINDEPNNETRFLLLGVPQHSFVGKNDKSTFIFSTENKAGALCDVLNIFKDDGINMTYISSKPSRKSLGEYCFYIDIDGNVLEDKVARAMFKILSTVKEFKHLGSYPKYK